MTESNAAENLTSEVIAFDNADIVQDIAVNLVRSSHTIEETGEVCDRHLFIELQFKSEKGVSVQLIDMASSVGMAFIMGTLSDAIAEQAFKIVEELEASANL